MKAFPCYWTFVWGIHWSPVNSPNKSQWRGALMFPLVYPSTNGWVHNRVAGGLRRHHSHYDVTVMVHLSDWSRSYHSYGVQNVCNIHDMMTSSKGNIFRITVPLCGEFTGHRWIPVTEAGDEVLWRYSYLRLNKRLSQPSERRWFETPSCSLWRHCYGNHLGSYWHMEMT